MEILFKFERMTTSDMPHAYWLYLPVCADETFIADLKELPVFTAVHENVGRSCVVVDVNPVIGLARATTQVRPLVAALLMRSGAPDGISFEHYTTSDMPHAYWLYLPVCADETFIADLKELPVFTAVRENVGESYVVVDVNPVIGLATAKRQVVPLVRELAKRQRKAS